MQASHFEKKRGQKNLQNVGASHHIKRKVKNQPLNIKKYGRTAVKSGSATKNRAKKEKATSLGL